MLIIALGYVNFIFYKTAEWNVVSHLSKGTVLSSEMALPI